MTVRLAHSPQPRPLAQVRGVAGVASAASAALGAKGAGLSERRPLSLGPGAGRLFGPYSLSPRPLARWLAPASAVLQKEGAP